MEEKSRVKKESLEEKVFEENEECEDESKKELKDKSGDEDNGGESGNEPEEESIGKIRLGVASPSFSSQATSVSKRGSLEKEVFTGDDVWNDGEVNLDLVEEKYRKEDREKEEENDSVKYGAKEDNFYDGSSKKHYDEKNLSRHNDDFEIEIGSRDLKDNKNEEFYSLRKDKEKEKRESLGLFESESRTYFETKRKEYLA